MALDIFILIISFTALFYGIKKLSKKNSKKELHQPKINKPEIKLKNNDAELLRQKETITLNGETFHLWQHPTRDNIRSSMTWDKMPPYKELNAQSTGENGTICITGTFQISRKEVVEYATAANYFVRGSVSRFTDFLVIGTENISPNKLAKTFELINKGEKLKIVDENTFLQLLAEKLNL